MNHTHTSSTPKGRPFILSRRAGFLLALTGAAGSSLIASSCNKSGKAGETSSSGGSGGPSFMDFAKPMVGAFGGENAARGLTIGTSLVSAADALGLENDQQTQIAIGESITCAVTAKTPLTTDLALNNYVSMVGFALLDSSSSPGLEIMFGVLETEDVNAFSAPNGAVMITRGALRLMQDESELAGVLGHEMTHVFAKHGIKSVATGQFWNAALEGGLAAANVRGPAAVFVGAADTAVDGVLVKGYDRGTEFDADAGAVQLCKAAGYDPNGLVRFLQRLETRPGGGLFSTHPGRPERIAKLQALIGPASGAKMAARYETSALRK